MSENRLLRNIFLPKLYELTGGWRQMHSEGLRNVYCYPNIVKMIKSMRIRCAGHVVHEEISSVYESFVEYPQEKILLGRPRRRWEDNIKIDIF
jgi:hypothetical protein